MRIELPDGNWADVRDALLGKDKTAAHKVMQFVIKEGQEQVMDASVMDKMHDALLANIITAWSFDQPIPSRCESPVDAVGELDIDIYNELHAKTAHLMKKVNFKAPN